MIVLQLLLLSAAVDDDADNDDVVVVVVVVTAVTAVPRVAIKCSLVLLPLLGMTWCFGVLSVSSDTVAFSYIFAILNSLQVRCLRYCNKDWDILLVCSTFTVVFLAFEHEEKREWNKL